MVTEDIDYVKRVRIINAKDINWKLRLIFTLEISCELLVHGNRFHLVFLFLLNWKDNIRCNRKTD